MKNNWARALGLGLVIVFFATCSAGGDGDDNPPPTIYKYFAYVANRTTSVGAFLVNPTTGTWTPVPNSPFPAAPYSYSVAVEPTGKYAFVTCYYIVTQSHWVEAYTIDPASGQLTRIVGSPFLLGQGTCLGIDFDSTGRFAYVAESPSQVRAFDISLGQGALTSQISVYAFGGEGENTAIKTDPSGHNLLYVANSAIGVYGYKINASTGELTLIQGSPFLGTSHPLSLAMDPQSKFLYAANMDGGVSAFSVNTASGQLTAIAGSPFAAGGEPCSVAVDPTGKFLYVANRSSDEVMAYTINAASGALVFVGASFKLGSSPCFVAVDPTGKYAYVADRGANSVSAYAIIPATGALTEISGSPFPFSQNQGPSAITIIKIAQ